MDQNIDEVVRTHSRSEERDVGHVGDVGDGHPDGRMPRIGEGLDDIGERKAVLHERAAEGVVMVVQTQKFKTSSLRIEKQNCGDQEKNRQNVFLHVG